MDAFSGGRIEVVGGCLGASGSVVVWPHGKPIRSFDTHASAGGVAEQLWRGRQADGSRVQPGRYRVVVIAQDAAGTVRERAAPACDPLTETIVGRPDCGELRDCPDRRAASCSDWPPRTSSSRRADQQIHPRRALLHLLVAMCHGRRWRKCALPRCARFW
jgi:hypothetical protein